MQTALLLTAAPGPRHRIALDLAHALQASGHPVLRVFFFRDAVAGARADAPLAPDWQALARSGVDLVVCSGAAGRRGLSAADLAPGCALSGLGQLIAATADAGRVVTVP